ncbi:MAG: ribonuclease HI [Elusimicrobia bacterium]|nr:ribonuclease HI [Elusimicrobiota bacterium]
MSSRLLSALAYTDGACLGNPGPGGWGVVLLLPDGKVVELGGSSRGPDGRASPTTNNRMELQAAIEALRALKRLAPEAAVELRPDSSYLVSGITAWIFGWRRRGWKRPDGEDVANRDLWEELSSLTAAKGPGRLRWVRVRGHADVPGNCRADAIAASFAEGRRPRLYEGPLIGYGMSLGMPDEAAPAAEAPSGPRTAVRPEPGFPVYLSLVEGRLSRHAAWPACEALVKGRSGAKFKRVRSAAEERETLRGWGL